MADTSRFQDGGIYIEQVSALPATAVTNALVTFEGTLYRFDGAVWQPLGGTGSGGLFVNAASDTVTNTTDSTQFDQTYTPAAASVIGSVQGTLTVRAGGNFTATGTPDIDINLNMLTGEPVKTFSSLPASGNWYIERTFGLRSFDPATGRWQGPAFTTYVFEGLTTQYQVFDLATYAAGSAEIGVTVEWSAADPGNSIGLSLLSVTSAR